GSVADEIAVSYPLRLNKLELPMQIRADQQEDATALSAVILEHALRQGWPVICAAAQEMVEIDGDDVVFQGVARIHTTNVRAERAFQSLHVICVAKIIVAISVSAQCGIVAVRSQHQGGAAAPSAHHFCSNQLLFLRRRGLGPQVSTKRGNVHVEFAERDESAVAA